jgi:hypothetical protein
MSLDDFRDPGYSNIWDIRSLETALDACLHRVNLSRQSAPESIGFSSNPIREKFKLALEIVQIEKAPLNLLCWSVSESTPVALAARLVLVRQPTRLDALEPPYPPETVALASQALAMIPGGVPRLLRFSRRILETSRLQTFSPDLLKWLGVALRREFRSPDNSEIAEDRELSDEEKNVHALVRVLELPGSTRLIVPLLSRLPFALRRVHVAALWPAWLKFPGFFDIITDLVVLDPFLVTSFLLDRFEVDVYPRLPRETRPAREALAALRGCPGALDRTAGRELLARVAMS